MGAPRCPRFPVVPRSSPGDRARRGHAAGGTRCTYDVEPSGCRLAADAGRRREGSLRGSRGLHPARAPAAWSPGEFLSRMQVDPVLTVIIDVLVRTHVCVRPGLLLVIARHGWDATCYRWPWCRPWRVGLARRVRIGMTLAVGPAWAWRPGRRRPEGRSRPRVWVLPRV